MSVEFPDPLWRRVFELAWESYTSGGWGVGAIVLDADGRLVTEGRNRGGDSEGRFRQLTGTPLAHAVLNALAALPDDAVVPGLTVRSSLEPCGLCAAAIAMRRVGRVEYAAVDPLWHGLFAAHHAHPLLAERWPAQVGPLDGPAASLAVVAEAMPLSRYLRTSGRGAASTSAYTAHSPSLLGLAQELAEDDDVQRLDLDEFLSVWAERIEATDPTRLRASVLRLGQDDWERGRDLRIASLAESPQAFQSTVEQALEFTEADWRRRLATATTLHAVFGGRSVGTVTVRAQGQQAGDAEITGMWVDPSARGLGVGAQLIEAAVDFWRGLGGQRVFLWVVEGNIAAAALYARSGFAATGRTELQDDGRLEIELRRVL